jgi:hypothetical protein
MFLSVVFPHWGRVDCIIYAIYSLNVISIQIEGRPRRFSTYLERKKISLNRDIKQWISELKILYKTNFCNRKIL